MVQYVGSLSVFGSDMCAFICAFICNSKQKLCMNNTIIVYELYYNNTTKELSLNKQCYCQLDANIFIIILILNGPQRKQQPQG